MPGLCFMNNRILHKQRNHKNIILTIFSLTSGFMFITYVASLLNKVYPYYIEATNLWWEVNLLALVAFQILWLDYKRGNKFTRNINAFCNKYGIVIPKTEFWFTIALTIGVLWIDIGATVAYSKVMGLFSNQEATGFSPVFPGIGILFTLQAAAVFIPIVEEVLFRGMFMHFLLRSPAIGPYFIGKYAVRIFWNGTTPFVAILITAFIFGIGHGLYGFIPTFIIGLAYGVLRLRTGSILPCIAVHCAHNMFAVIA